MRVQRLTRLTLCLLLLWTTLASASGFSGSGSGEGGGATTCSELTDAANSCSTDTTNASNITTGIVTLPVHDKGGAVYDVRAYGALCDGVTDDSTAVLAALSAANTANGGIIVSPASTCVINSQIAIPNNGATPPVQKSLRLTGAGASHNGQGGVPSGGTIWKLGYAGAGAKIDTRGLGTLEIDHLTLQETTAGTTTPFIFTTNTTLLVHDIEIFGHTSKSSVTCDQDAIVLGGTGTTFDGTVNAPFQGYGTVIQNNYFNRIRRMVYGKTYVNGIIVRDNTVWAGSGSNVTTAISAATNANPTVLTSTGHDFQTGTTFRINITGFTGGWTSANNSFVATVIDANTFSIPVNATGFGAMAGSPAYYTGAAIEFVGLSSSSNSGNVISSNLIEIGGYPIGILCTYCTSNSFLSNNFFDSSSNLTMAYYRFFGASAVYNLVVDGMRTDSQGVLGLDSGGTITNTYLTPHQTQYSILAQPWRFHNTMGFKNNVGLHWLDTTGNWNQHIYLDSGNTLYIKNPASPAGHTVIVPASGSAQVQVRNNAQSVNTFVVDTPNSKIGLLTNAPTATLGFDGQAARSIGMNRNTTAGTPGNSLTINGGGAASGATNANAGDLVLQSGVGTGTGSGNILLKASPVGSTGTSDNAVTTVAQVAATSGVGYLNFGATAGSGGYGVRDNAGAMECKNSGGSWSACQASGGAPTDAHYLTTQAESGLSAESNLGALSTGLLLCTTASSICTPSTVAAPAGTVVGTSDTQTLTNKRLTERVVTLTDAATVTPNADTTDVGVLNTLSQTTTIAAPSGTPTDGQILELRIKSSSVRTLSWNAAYVGTTQLPIPTSTTGSSVIDYFAFQYNSNASQWDYLGGNNTNFPLAVSAGGTGTASTLTGLVRGNASAMTAAEMSGDCTTSGSNALTCTKLNGTSFAGTNGNLVSFGASNIPADSGVVAANVTTAASNYTSGNLVQAAGNNKTTSDSGIAASTVATASSTTTFTNKTYDVEGTGNILTIPVKVWLPSASCQNSTATINGDTPTSNPAVAACVTGTNTQKGVADFADSSDVSYQDHVLLPADWTGAVDVKFVWFSSVTTGSVVWQMQTICVADAETDDPSFNTASTVTDATKGTANQLNTATITGVTTTGCAAGELLHLKVRRDAGHASDDLAGTARLVGVELTLRRAM